MAPLALVVEEPILTLMNKPPRGQSDPLITNIMWRNIIAQAAYQVAVVLTLMFKAGSIFGVHSEVIQTLVFTTFVLLQVFNLFNARDLEEKNVLKGILKNKLFLGITGITAILLVVMVEFLNKFARTKRLDWKQWGICIGIAAFSLPVCWLVKLLPVPKRQMLNAHTSLASVDHRIE
ncbi:Calcium-transporting ATPase [Handroanthus impetiginosus]|uniref:Calcium-transporting ATPase n=1 Tax=Handroanthus impetiginosus TaxID=429701 RepID=A0A2G9GYH9_9LAMI|nr:Calcium-transporting ATPase [Handroanthus impetiginosus]PIN13402.1 Calcium-transporting ATPase [Handroanthus impetiginosus]